MYVDPNRNLNAGNLRWLMAYCKPDLPRAIGAIVLYAVSAAMALITPLISARIVDQVIATPRTTATPCGWNASGRTQCSAG